MSFITAQLPIIGYLRSPLSQKFGLPRQPNLVDIPATIEFISPFSEPLAFVGLEQFSHIWLIWQFHQNRDNHSHQFRAQVRPPRLGGNQKIGVFATRSMYRPANIGLSVVQLAGVRQTNNRVVLDILGADMVDGTPILDIKPYIAYSDSIADAISGFAEQPPVKKRVQIDAQVMSQLAELPTSQQLDSEDIRLICELLAQDPRPAYRQHEQGSEFVMRYKHLDVIFMQNSDNSLVWLGIQAI